jgi:hypothetical protein
MAQWEKYAIATAAVCLFTAIVQTLYSDVTRGYPFWPNLARNFGFDVAAYSGLWVLGLILIWALP